MNPKELRIGNCVYVDERIVEVVAIDGKENKIEVRSPKNEVTIVYLDKVKISAIALSVDRLQQCCGFDGNGVLELGIDSHAYYLKMNKDHVILLDKQEIPVIHFWDVKYVHQLQNLFFALKGSELPVRFKHHI
jgi:hypothetical protein